MARSRVRHTTSRRRRFLTTKGLALSKYFYSYYDDDFDMNTTIFASGSEILDGDISGEVSGADVEKQIGVGGSCEDYIVLSERPLNEIKEVCLRLGYIEDERIKDCGWV